MKKRLFLNELKKRNILIIIILTFLLFLIIFLLFKNEYFYFATEYIEKYLDYYKDRYLHGDPSNLIVYNYAEGVDMTRYIKFFVEEDVIGIYSSFYLYIASFAHKFFSLYMYVIPFVIFSYVINNFYDEIYNKASISFINRVGLKNYINNKLIINSLICGFIIFIPKFLYFISLNIFFPSSVSNIHFIDGLAFLSQSFLYVGYSYHPLILIIVDFLISFIYGTFLSCLSILVILLIKNKSLSFVIYGFILLAISIFCIAIKIPHIFSYVSIFCIYNSSNIDTFNAILYCPLIFISFLFTVIFLVVKIVYKRRVVDNI